MENKIEDLFTDSGNFDESEIVSIIKPYIVIQKGTFDIYFKNVEKYNASDKLLLYLLTKKLLKFKNHISEEPVSAQEFHKKTGIKKGTVDPAFKDLRERGFIVGSGSSYEIPNRMIPKILKIFKK